MFKISTTQYKEQKCLGARAAGHLPYMCSTRAKPLAAYMVCREYTGVIPEPGQE